jgi:UDP-N-acetyl-D-galactosamine dehydrogenase
MSTSSFRRISVIGVGYVGLPIAAAFARKQEVIAFDIDSQRIAELKKGFDRTNEIDSQDLLSSNLHFTSEKYDLGLADFHIITVPTPITAAKQPDLGSLLNASRIVGGNLKKNDIVVYESTVYPGATEEECIPVLEESSSLKCGEDFFVGYSPERINTGDKEHTFTSICKVISAQNKRILDIIAEVYANVVHNVYKASSIKVAEAAKIIENTQRDINIALVNELAMIFKKLNIDTLEVLEVAGTKWNFLPFRPGLVGGHCIGVDPYYLTYKAQKVGLNPEIILAGRRINDNMGKYIAEQTVKRLVSLGKSINGAKVAILGFSFKENCPDVRNTRVIDLVNELKSYHVDVLIHDPVVHADEVLKEYNISLVEWDSINNIDVIILTVAHSFYKRIHVTNLIDKLTDPKLIIDVKGILNMEQMKVNNVSIWRL